MLLSLLLNLIRWGIIKTKADKGWWMQELAEFIVFARPLEYNSTLISVIFLLLFGLIWSFKNTKELQML